MDRPSLDLDIRITGMVENRFNYEIVLPDLDSSVTKEDWNNLWDNYLEPFLDRQVVNEAQLLRRDRGGPILEGEALTQAIARGGRVHQGGLRVVEYASFYHFYYHHHGGDLEATVADYLEKNPEDPVLKAGEVDLRTLISNIEALEEIMSPAKMD